MLTGQTLVESAVQRVRIYRLLRREYGDLKNSIAETCDNDIGRYCDRKDAYVKRIEAVALKEMARNKPHPGEGK